MINVEQLIRVVTVVHVLRKHQQWIWHHHPKVNWLYDARMTSPRTCERCKNYDGLLYTGRDILTQFEWHTHYKVNIIRPMIHPNCRCRLHYVGGKTDISEEELAEFRSHPSDYMVT